MFRGATMLKHALEWKSPSVGKGAKLDAVRGILWRHVMAYSGFEQLEMGLFGNQPNKSKERELFLASMNVERVLPGPILSQRAMNNLEERQENIESLCEFLNIHKNQRERFTNWLMGHVTQGGDDLMRTLMICAQLRHLVAHGALSADRSRKLGLIHSYSQAPDFLGEVALGYTSALVD